MARGIGVSAQRVAHRRKLSAKNIGGVIKRANRQ